MFYIFHWVTDFFLTAMPLRFSRKAISFFMGIGFRKKIHSGVRRRLLIDVSVIAQSDAGSGIQRVVRALTLEFYRLAPDGFEVIPIMATKKEKYTVANNYWLELTGKEYSGSAKLSIRAGDIFLGLDLATNRVTQYFAQLLYWKIKGVQLFFVVYDLLPELHPEWFNEKSVKNYRKWLRAICAGADGVICISQSVEIELQKYLKAVLVGACPVRSSWFHLGADIAASAPTKGGVKESEHLFDAITCRPTVLVAGTIEPRKMHAQVLTAFELLWEDGWEVNLVIVGRPGWRTECIQKRLYRHSKNMSLLYWLDNASDEMLCMLYQRVDGVLQASAAEGFGLPIYEAAKAGKPVLLRDIPVFREIAGQAATYFSGDDPASLAKALADWPPMRRNEIYSELLIPWLTWEQSAVQFRNAIKRLDHYFIGC